MTLQEALARRGRLQVHIEDLVSRLHSCSRVLEGIVPPEEPEYLLGQVKAALSDLETLVGQIERTNRETNVTPWQTLSDLLVRRNFVQRRAKLLKGVADHAVKGETPYYREGRYDVTVQVTALYAEVASLSREYEELDNQIQKANWQTQLAE
ncbi:MAG: DIP1984 family protein [Candidatus Hydrogenedentes bacterium]|nr:DIP1984 family protein [Candidatus Hydrogenedentota bacterium]